MLPGNPQVLTCPFCGEKKEILSLMSGNTCGAILWSDIKQDAPMVPTISRIQKCPKCGKYYFIYKQEVVYADKGWSGDCGTLTFPETIEAYQQFTRDNEIEDLTDEANIRFMLFHAFNDYYYRNVEVETKEVNASHHEIFVESGLWLINNLINDDLFRAEFYREIGDFDKADEIASTLSYDDGLRKYILNEIRKRIESRDCKVFQIN